MTPAAKAVLASMTVECREALKEVSGCGWTLPVTESDNDGEWWWYPLQPNEPDSGSWPWCPTDPTAIASEAARTVGGDGWQLDTINGVTSAFVWMGEDCACEVSGPDPLTAALELFKAAHGTVSA